MVVKVKTFQDFLEAVQANNKAAFILSAIEEYRQSDLFLRAQEATEYYARRNTAINKRMSFLQRKGINIPIKFHKISSGYYPQMIDEWTGYTLGGGLTIDKEKKDKLGNDFEYLLLNNGVIPACNSGVCWGFWDNDHIVFFDSLEAFGLFDERDNDLKALIRFWQIDADKPMFVELFEFGGITEYSTGKSKNKLTEIKPQRPYKTKVFRDSISEFVVNTEVYGELPIYPLYVNRLKESEFNDGLKSYIDAYDFISSDQVDQITMSEGVYSIVKNYGGEGLADMFEKLQYRIFPTDDNAGTDVAMHVIEAPFQAKQATLEFIERRIYADFPMPNPRLDGRAVTATEIKAANKSLDIKSDILEWYACKFVESIFKLNGIPFEKDEIKFARRGLINDTEIVNNTSTMLSDGYIDIEAALNLSTIIPDSEKSDILARLDIAAQNEANLRFEFEQENDQIESEQKTEV